MYQLNNREIQEVGGGFLANIGMGMAGATGGMSLYAISNWNSLSGSGFVSAAAGGFVSGALGFSPAANLAGAAVAGVVSSSIDDKEDS